MLKIVALAAFAAFVLTGLGWAVLSVLRPALRRHLLPAAPLMGVAFLVCVLHTTGLVASVATGLWFVGVLAAACVGLAARRGSLRPWADRSTLAWCGVALAVGAPLAMVAVAPSLDLGSSRVVSASPSNDAVYYVSVTSWLEDNSVLDVPTVQPVPLGSEPSGAVPGDGPAETALALPLRVGQELVQASLNLLTGEQSEDTFVPWLGAWVLFVPGGCISAASILGAGRVTGLVAGVAVTSSTILVQQAYNQNAASVLGLALVPLVMALFVAALAPGARGSERLAAALVLAALVGTYSEFAPFLVPAVAVAVLARRRGLRASLGRAALVVGLALVLAPLAWVRAAISLLTVGSGEDTASVSPYLDPDLQVVANRLVGFGTAVSDLGVSVATGLAVLVLVGWAAVLVLGPGRGLWWGFGAAASVVIVVLSTQGLDYAQRRAVDVTLPIGLFAAVLGLSSLLGLGTARWRASEPRWLVGDRLAALGTVVVTTLTLATWVAVNTRSSLSSYDVAALPARHVDDDFAEADDWVHDLGGPSGDDVSVLVPSFFDQQWLTLTLAHESAVEYPALRPDYLRVSSFWSGGRDRYWLVGDGVQVDADPGVVIRENDRFRLLDLSRGDAVIAAPYDLLNWNLFVRDDGGFATVGSAAALVVRTPGASPDIELTVRSESPAALDVLVEAPGEPGAVLTGLAAAPEQLVVGLPPGDDPVLVSITISPPLDPNAPRWLVLSGVQRVG